MKLFMKNVIKRIFIKSLFFTRLISLILYPFYKNNKKMNLAIQNYKHVIHNKKYKFTLKTDMFISRFHYRLAYDDYFMFHFYYLNDNGRKQFVGDIERKDILYPKGTEITREIFNDKYKCYQKFKKYYARDVISSLDNYAKFCEFVKKHKEFIVKPIDGGCGMGVYKINLKENPVSEKELFESIKKNGNFVIEEIIQQTTEFSCLHPASLNTLRICTFIRGNDVFILFAFFRIGRNGNCVDNGGSGGIIVSVDLKTGIANSNGVTEDCQEFVLHPNTGIQISGFVIPEWDAAVKLARELVRIVPEQPCVGWDLAYTGRGWIMVEGNQNTMFVGPQITLQKGLREVIKKFF